MDSSIGELLLRIRCKIADGQYYYTKHAILQSIKRKINKDEVIETIEHGEIIEHYPDDKYGPSCLIYGKTDTGRPLHVVCSIGEVWIITVYEPALEQWGDFRKRR